MRLRCEIGLLCLVFAGLCWPLLFSDRVTNYSQDESSFHLPAVRQIAAKWPALDVNRDSLSATPPGYHYALATVSLITGTGARALRLVNWCVSTLVLVVLYLHLRKSLPFGDACLLLLPLLLSNFFVKSACWVVTDNAALLLVTLTLLIHLKPVSTPAWLGSVTGAAAVFVRQMSIWLIALPAADLFAARNTNRFQAWWRTGAMAAAPLGVLLFLIGHWHGLTPPIWRDAAFRFSTAGPLYLLAVFCLFALPYIPPSTERMHRYPSQFFGSLAVAVLVAVGLWLATPSTSDHSQGRWGGYLWNLSDHLPAVGQRSLLFLVLAIFGACSVRTLWLRLRQKGLRREASLFLLTVVAWGSTFLVNRQVFQRYFEPTVLVLFILLTPGLLAGTKLSRRYRLGLLACGGAQLAITLATAYRAMT